MAVGYLHALVKQNPEGLTINLLAVPRNSAPAVRKTFTELLLTEGKKRLTASRLSAQLVENSSTGSSEALVLSTTPKNSGWHALARQPGTPMYSPAPAERLSKSIDAQVGFFWQPRPSGSRYRSEFEELEFLGRGGGGQVVKARNRLDGHLYAVKKIRLPNDRASEIKILREVTIWCVSVDPTRLFADSSLTLGLA